MIRKDGSMNWMNHATKIDLLIENTLKRTSKSILFAHRGWTVAVAKKHVKDAHEFNGSQESLVGRNV